MAAVSRHTVLALLVVASSAPTAPTDRCVFRDPFEKGAYVQQAAYWIEMKYQLVNHDYSATRGTCAPRERARDAQNRRGWRRVVCAYITLIGERNGRDCVVRGLDQKGRCTGTIWQFTRDDDVRNLGARRLRFRVVMVRHPQDCSIVPRVWQIAPFTPRLARP